MTPTQYSEGIHPLLFLAHYAHQKMAEVSPLGEAYVGSSDNTMNPLGFKKLLTIGILSGYFVRASAIAEAASTP